MGSRHGRATFSVLLFQVGAPNKGRAAVQQGAPRRRPAARPAAGGPPPPPGRATASCCCYPPGPRRRPAPTPAPLLAYGPVPAPRPRLPPPRRQDLAVVVLLMLIPLLAPDPVTGSSGGAAKIAQALGLAAVKAVVCICGIIAGGRIFIRPLYKKISNLANAEIFAATTLLVVLGTSMATQLAGLSLALGAFLAGLLIAETEFALQVRAPRACACGGAGGAGGGVGRGGGRTAGWHL
jgi:hypothetical protein